MYFSSLVLLFCYRIFMLAAGVTSMRSQARGAYPTKQAPTEKRSVYNINIVVYVYYSLL
jgi:hypothetical protein